MAIEPTHSTSDQSESESEPALHDTPKPDSASDEEESESDSESDKTSKPVPTSSSNPKVLLTSEAEETSKIDAPEAADLSTKPLSSSKKQLFQRLFSEENEIELIQGMIDYVDQKCKDPLSDVSQFYEFVKESLRVDVTLQQVLNKSRKLKQKFEKNVARVQQNGKVRSFVNPHEKKMFLLSENLWGKNNVVMKGSKKVNVTNKKRKTASFGNGNEAVKTEFEVPAEDEIMSMGLEKLSEAEKAETEDKWKELKVQELELYIKKLELMKEQAQLVLNAINQIR